MKLRMPDYYKDFKCIADSCKDSCCSAGWEIEIDDKTMNKYNIVSGEFGNKLNKNISHLNGCNNFILNKDNTCPFFINGLCEIYIKLGEKNLCKICSEHPRYYEWFDGLKEGGIGLCCEEAARIIISNIKKFSTYDINIPDEEFDEYNKDLYTYLKSARKKIINHLEDTSFDFNNRIRNVIWYGNILQQNIDFDLFDDDKIVNIVKTDTTYYSGIIDIFKFLSDLEINNENWIMLINNAIKTYENDSSKFSKFEESCPEIQNYLKNLSIYFIWRYFIKGCFDGDVLSKVKFMGLSIYVIKWLMFCKWVNAGSISLSDCIDISKKYSEEIEYCDENLLKIFNESYCLNYFSTESFLKYFN